MPGTFGVAKNGSHHGNSVKYKKAKMTCLQQIQLDDKH